VGDFWFTTLSAIRRGEPLWEAIEPYEAPVRRFLAARWPRLAADARDDLVHDVLLLMRERLVAGYEAGRGPFRQLLKTAISNKVRDRFRRRGDAPLGDDTPEIAAASDFPSDDEIVAIDLEAEIARAVRLVHDRHAFSEGGEKKLVYALAGVLVHGLGESEIARKEGLSRDQVKRLLARAREEIVGALMIALLPEAAPAVRSRAADLARACLREPRREAILLEDEKDARVREAAGSLAARLREARARPLGAGGDDFARGIAAIFDERASDRDG
jgi:DNA-directed RNA polymerase specialized sigma24 family protein